MARIIEIEDINDERVQIFSRLTEAQLRNRLEPDKGIFIAESPKVIGTALDVGYLPLSILTEERHIHGSAAEVIGRCGDVPVYTAPREVLSALAGYTLTRGVLCAFRRPQLPRAEDICGDASRIAVLENIADSTNVGAIFRSAAALGIDAVLVTPSCCDPFCRRAVRVSMGTVLQIPWTYIGDEPSDWETGGIDKLHEMGFAAAAMALVDPYVSLEDERLMNEKKLALILGTEGDGLMKTTIAKADYRVMIPMSRNVDSLNVGAAAAVAFWQVCRK